MELLVAILTVALLALVVAVISAPLRRSRPRADAVSSERSQLEAAREAKYREIRDCELDYRTGKLSSADYQATDAALRAEAFEILDRLQASEHERSGEGSAGAGESGGDSLNSEIG